MGVADTYEYWDDRVRFYDKRVEDLNLEIKKLNKFLLIEAEMRDWCSDKSFECSRKLKTPSDG